MKLLVRGDVHLDLVSDGLSRLEEQERVLGHTLDALKLLNPDVFVDLGDLFDRPRPSPAAYGAALGYVRDLAGWWRTLAAARELGSVETLEDRTFVLAGNHDKVSRGEVSALHPIEALWERGEVKVARPVTKPEWVDLEGHGVRLVFLPFVTDWEARQRLHEGAFNLAQEYLDDFVAGALLDAERVVAFTHLEVPGSRNAADERVQRDVGTRIPEVLLEDDRVLRVYAGHVHRYQTVGKVTVVGSALHVDFGESADAKGMIYAEV
jgi:DNA repair exonuclease SbcCD nuclease subunit